MKAYDLLRKLDFGEDVAEHERNLAQYFVKTSSFDLFVDDEADLLLGPKGTGKSAIARYLTSSDSVSTGPDDVLILPAFNLEDAPLFRSMAADLSGASEELMRLLFFGYIVGLVGNRLLELPLDRAVLKTLDELLEASNLKAGHWAPPTVWRQATGWVKRLRPKGFGGSVTFDASGQPVFGAGIQFETDAAGSSRTSTPAGEVLTAILRENIRVLTLLRRRCWVVFDRLDEAFVHDRGYERMALRGLLWAHNDICSYGRTLKPKLFLRSDLYDRITQNEGFVNATHLRRTDLRWDDESIVDLIFKRVSESAEVCREFGLSVNARNDRERRAELRKIFPRTVDGHQIFAWLLTVTTDGTGLPNPRNVLTLLREARRAAMRRAERDQEEVRGFTHLISPKALEEGRAKLSENRLRDTVYAEFNELRPYVERLQGQADTLTSRSLAHRFGLATDSVELDRIIDDLVYIGFLHRHSPGVYAIAELYRPAMHLTAAAVPVGTAEPADDLAAGFTAPSQAVAADTPPTNEPTAAMSTEPAS